MASLEEYRHTFRPEAMDRDVFVDGSSRLADRDFWPAHLYAAVCTLMDADTVVTAFDRDEDELIELARQLGTGPWLTFTTPIGHCELSVIYRNYDDDPGLDYVVSYGTTDVEICIVEGHFHGPGLSWPELWSLGAAAGPVGSVPWAHSLLLHAPAMGDVDAGDEAVTAMAGALRLVGATGDVAPLATLLATDLWEETVWSTEDGVTICLAGTCTRNPESPYNVSADRLRLVSDALNAARR